MTPAITSKTLKSIARKLEKAEDKAFGRHLAHTTVLNLLTQALGLGNEFGHFARKQKALRKTPEPSFLAISKSLPETPGAKVYFILEAESWATQAERDRAERKLQDLVPAGWMVDVLEAAHGRQVVCASTQVLAGLASKRREIAAQAAIDLYHGLDIRAQDDEIFPIAGMLIDAEAQGRKLHVTYRHYDNDQVCSNEISRDLWEHRDQPIYEGIDLRLSDEDVFLAAHLDEGISEHCDANDITIEDVLTSIEFHGEEMPWAPQWTDAERDAILEMSRQQGLTPEQITRQAMRAYQLQLHRLAAGETVEWSGDAERARQFAGA